MIRIFEGFASSESCAVGYASGLSSRGLPRFAALPAQVEFLAPLEGVFIDDYRNTPPINFL